jgi:Fibronectin type III domain
MTRSYVLTRNARRGRRRPLLTTAAAALAAAAWMHVAAAGGPAPGPGAMPSARPDLVAADEASCRLVQIQMVPHDNLQIVVWIEDAAGNYVDTAFITRLTGTYGMGNRPGMMEFNSGPRWPYGRRTTTFPVWAHRHGLTWPQVVFQDGDEADLSHSMGQSSMERFYCRPISENEDMWDTQTCATSAYTDKGKLAPELISLYPPRQDVELSPSIDHEDVDMFPLMNPFDAVSRATPPGNEPFRIDWQIPDALPPGEYVAWVEVSKEFDQNEHYAYPEPDGIPWVEYGVPYRGQPSVVYKVPFSLTPGAEGVVSTADYVGYGDPDGNDGELRSPDVTITTGVDGSGASRLLLSMEGETMYRVRVNALPSVADPEMPGVLGEVSVVDATPTTVTLSFTAPGDDDMLGMVAGYEVRYLAGGELSGANFTEGVPADVQVAPVTPGSMQALTVENLLPRLDYSIAVRAFDECKNYGEVRVVQVTTPELEGGHVDACFVATAAFGSLMERDVEMLRRFRDRFLRTHVAGELLVESYYTFGPALSRLIAPSETLRRAARAGLAPLVETVRGLAPGR